MKHAFDLQKALDARLLPVLAAMTPPVALYDRAPQDAAFPFVEFSRVIGLPANTLAEGMTAYTVTLTVQSDFAGQEQVLAILAAIETALDGEPLTLDAGTAVRVDLDRADTARDQDGRTYIGSALYTALIEHQED